jgi:hypothetical protein
MTTIENLPEEILCEILKFMDARAVLRSPRLVCRFWNSVAVSNPLWRRFCEVDSIPIPADCDDMLRCFREARTWTLCAVVDLDLIFFLVFWVVV